MIGVGAGASCGASRRIASAYRGVLSRDRSTKRPPRMAACRRPFVIRVVVSCAYVKTDIFGSSFSRQSV
jgi:hypothetical protein